MGKALTGTPMGLATPSALVLLVLVPVLLWLHLRRDPSKVVRVASPDLWRGEDEPRPPRARRKRLRADPLLLLQVLFLVLGVLALARPILRLGSGGDFVFLFDASASMGALEDGVPRFALARDRALEVLGSLGRGDRVQLMVADPRPRVVCDFSADKGELRRRIRELEPSEAETDLTAALATALAEGGRVVVFGDGAAGSSVPDLPPDRVRYVQVGSSSDNVGITRLSVRASRRGAFGYDVFAEVANFSSRPRETALRVAAGEREVGERSLRLEAGERRPVVFEGVAFPGDVLRASLDVEDDLAADNRAYVLTGLPVVQVLLVTEGGFFLRKALQVDPTVELTVLAPGEYSPAFAEGFDVVVFDGVEPEPPGPRRALLVHHVSGAPRSWEHGRFRRVEVGFDAGSSSWPLTVAFPVFMANTLRWLGDGAAGNPVQLRAGEALDWTLPRSLHEVSVEDPRGRSTRVPVSGGRLAFDATGTTGIYAVRGDGFEGKLAVNLLSAAESDIAPRIRAEDAASGERRPDPSSMEVSLYVVLAALVVLFAEWVVYCRRRVEAR